MQLTESLATNVLPFQNRSFPPLHAFPRMTLLMSGTINLPKPSTSPATSISCTCYRTSDTLNRPN